MRKDGTFAKVAVTRHSNHPRWSASKPGRPKSPMIPAELHSQEYVGETSDNLPPVVTTGVEAADTARVRRPALNTNANRKHGGSSTIYRPKAEDLAGRDIIDAGTRVTAPTPVRTANRKPVPSVAIAKDTSADESVRLAAMQRHGEMIRDGIEYPESNVAWPASWDFSGR